MPPVTILGIGLSDQDAQTKPAQSVSSDLQTISSTTAGKFFIKIEQIPDVNPFALKLLFDGTPVEIKDNEDIMFTDGRAETYAVDFPMRLMKVQEDPHTIQFIIGTYVEDKFIEEGLSGVFFVYVTSETPVVAQTYD